tara:strand:+ start:187 stop:870 length:684 start_codon:yes stop_codon:yes gene_type:complete
MKKIKNIFFDLDHTIWDFEKNSSFTFKKIFKNYQIDVEHDKFLDIYVPINFKFWKLYREEKISKEFLRYNRLKSAFDKLSIKISDKTINNISDDYVNYLPTYNHLMPNAIKVLEYLKLSYNLFIITNGFKDVQNHKMESSGIKKYFKKIYDSESIGLKKPNLLVFNHAITDSNSLKSESLMIGDSLEADIEGALNAGLNAIHFIAHGERIHNKCKIIHDLDELIGIL